MAQTLSQKLAFRKWRYNNSHKARGWTLTAQARRRAKRDGLPFSLDKEDIVSRIAAGFCEVTGIPFQIPVGGGKGPWVPSLDRVDPALGYTGANVRVVVWLFNAAKQEFGDADVELLASYVSARQVKSCLDSSQENSSLPYSLLPQALSRCSPGFSAELNSSR